jgi:hypothetical protein
MDLSDGFRIAGHTPFRMRTRGISYEQIEQALAEYHTSYPAEQLPNVPYRCTIYQATVDGRQLKVYVQDGTHPPVVRTVAWKEGV